MILFQKIGDISLAVIWFMIIVYVLLRGIRKLSKYYNIEINDREW